MTAVPRADGQCYGRTFLCSSVGSHEYHRTIPFPPPAHFAVYEIDRTNSAAGLLMFDCSILAAWTDADENRDLLRYGVSLGMVGPDDTTLCVLSAGPCKITAHLINPPAGQTPEEHHAELNAATPWFVETTTPKSGASIQLRPEGSQREDEQ